MFRNNDVWQYNCSFRKLNIVGLDNMYTARIYKFFLELYFFDKSMANMYFYNFVKKFQ